MGDGGGPSSLVKGIPGGCGGLARRFMPAANSIDDLLEQMVTRNASDLHLSVGAPPAMRVRGHIERLADFPALAADDTQQLLYRIMSSEQQKNLEIDRKSTRLNSSHLVISYAVFCLKKKT